MSYPAYDLKMEVLTRVDDLVANDRIQTAAVLIDAALTLLAQQFPPNLDANERRLVQENYPEATDELVAARAMSEEGVVTALVLGIQMGEIAIDYSPLSHTPEMEHDLALSAEVVSPIVQACEDLFDNADRIGLSAFGMATLMMCSATRKATKRGVHPMKLARPLLETLGRVLEPNAPLAHGEHNESAIRALRERLGVSRETAKRIYTRVKRNH